MACTQWVKYSCMQPSAPFTCHTAMTAMRVTLVLMLSMCSLCKKHEILLRNEGVITGIDVRGCPCVVQCPCACRGLIFHFTDMGDTTRSVIDNGSFIQLPSSSTFPVYLTLDWQSTTRCGVKAIKIISYKLL